MILQKDWQKKFSKSVLERGKNDYENQRVTELQEKAGNLFSAAILGRERRSVSLTVKDGEPVRMSCQCPMARGGNPCEHMAALLYAIEANENISNQRQGKKNTEPGQSRRAAPSDAKNQKNRA